MRDAELRGEMKAALVRLEAVMRTFREGGAIIDRPHLTVITSPGTPRRTKRRAVLHLVERAS